MHSMTQEFSGSREDRAIDPEGNETEWCSADATAQVKAHHSGWLGVMRSTYLLMSLEVCGAGNPLPSIYLLADRCHRREHLEGQGLQLACVAQHALHKPG